MIVPDSATAADIKPIVVVADDPKVDESDKKPVVLDQKQSFVDQVSEGLANKIPAERFEKTAPETPVIEEEKVAVDGTDDIENEDNERTLD